MSHTRRLPTSNGFSLVEVMVAVLVISVGLLGIAKLQALSLSNTGNSRLRALAALEASSLASAMQADRGYWASVPTAAVPVNVTVTGAAITASSDPTLSAVFPCTGMATNCSVGQMAAYDLQQWAGLINSVVPNETTAVSCNVPAPIAPATTAPATCTITIKWTEQTLVNSNSAQVQNATTTASLQTPTYVLVVQP